MGCHKRVFNKGVCGGITMIKIYPSNWLMAAGIVGFYKIFGTDYIKNSHLELPQSFLNDIFPERFSKYVSELQNAYNIIGDFYNNSPLAQIWQKKMRDTLIDFGTNNEKAQEYENFASDKKNTFLKNINSILKKLGRRQILHQKFLDENTVDKAISVFKKYQEIQERIDKLSKEKTKILKEEFDKDEDFKEKFNNLINDLENSGLNDLSKLSEKIKDVVNKIVTEYQEDELKCSFCNERNAIRRFDKQTSRYLPVVLDEKHFTPLGASAKKLANLYWEGKPSHFLCLPCELIIYCAAFGFTKVDKNYIFINAPTTVKEIIEINEIWAEYLKQGGSKTFKDSLIEILKKMERAKAKWMLQNISFIELAPYSENTFNIYTFNVPVESANAVRKMIQSYPNNLKGIYDIFLDHIYSSKPLYDMVGNILYGYINKEQLNNFADNNLLKSSVGRLILSGKNLENPKNLLFFLKFQKEVEDYGQ